MYKPGQLLYIYLSDLKTSVRCVGICKERLGMLKEIKPLKENGKDEGIFVLVATNGQVWEIKTTDKFFNLATVEEVEEALSQEEVKEESREEWRRLIEDYKQFL